jgi:hypothetical protein
VIDACFGRRIVNAGDVLRLCGRGYNGAMARSIVAFIVLLATSAPAAADSLFLMLDGSPGLRVKGTCHIIDKAGHGRDAALDSLVPHRFEIAAAAASCTLNKMDERGLLRASLAFHDRAIILIETNAIFGALTVRSEGPWGPAQATRTGALLRRQSPTAPGTTQTVPPLGGTTVPPLGGTTVPQLKGTTVPQRR